MNLIKDKWEEKDKTEFLNYVYTFSKGKEKGDWEKRIINTNLSCIAVPANVISSIVKEIKKGNFLSFIDLWIWDNYSVTIIIGKLICNIKDFDLMVEYLYKYLEKCDNWANIDGLKFDINKDNKLKFFKLAKILIKEEPTFFKRLGVVIFMKLLNFKDLVDDIFNNLKLLKNENAYYVNMAVAWCLCEAFIKEREKTLEILSLENVNTFVLNKTISKCNDSFRVSKEDKKLIKTKRV